MGAANFETIVEVKDFLFFHKNMISSCPNQMMVKVNFINKTSLM
jgi:hypothetical protein